LLFLLYQFARHPALVISCQCHAWSISQERLVFKMKALFAGICFSLFSFSNLICSEIPDSVIPQGVGVNIHFVRGHEKDLDRIAAAGFKFIRMDFGWGGIERMKGQYDWSAYD